LNRGIRRGNGGVFAGVGGKKGKVRADPKSVILLPRKGGGLTFLKRVGKGKPNHWGTA